MRRHLTMLALAGLIGASVLATEASACHKKKKCECPPAPACPAPVVYEPCPPPEPVCEPCPPPKKKCALFSKMFAKKKKCEPVACPTPCPAPVAYYSAPAPYYAPAPSGQYLGSGQGY